MKKLITFIFISILALTSCGVKNDTVEVEEPTATVEVEDEEIVGFDGRTWCVCDDGNNIVGVYFFENHNVLSYSLDGDYGNIEDYFKDNAMEIAKERTAGIYYKTIEEQKEKYAEWVELTMDMPEEDLFSDDTYDYEKEGIRKARENAPKVLESLEPVERKFRYYKLDSWWLPSHLIYEEETEARLWVLDDERFAKSSWEQIGGEVFEREMTILESLSPEKIDGEYYGGYSIITDDRELKLLTKCEENTVFRITEDE